VKGSNVIVLPVIYPSQAENSPPTRESIFASEFVNAVCSSESIQASYIFLRGTGNIEKTLRDSDILTSYSIL